MTNKESISYKILCSRCKHEVEFIQEDLDNTNENNLFERCNNCGMIFYQSLVLTTKEVEKELTS